MQGNIAEIRSLPANFSRFETEIASGLRALYGEAAARDYLGRSRAAFSAHLAHPGVHAFAYMADGEVCGMAAGTVRGEQGDVFLAHVLTPWLGQNIESALMVALCDRMRQRGARRILCETIPLCALDLRESMRAQGFRCVPRLLMRASLESSGLTVAPLDRGTTLTPSHWRAAAECVVDAYVGHPDALLHAEVRSQPEAEAYIARAAGGSFGAVRQDFLRGRFRGAECSGLILGAIAAPDTGFVLQVAVRRSKQGRGLGTDLLRGLAEVFRGAGLRHVALGVTRGNPAERLYRRLGFTPLREVVAYAWQATD